MCEVGPERVSCGGLTLDRHKIDKPCLRLKGMNIRERREILLFVYPAPLAHSSAPAWAYR